MDRDKEAREHAKREIKNLAKLVQNGDITPEFITSVMMSGLVDILKHYLCYSDGAEDDKSMIDLYSTMVNKYLDLHPNTEESFQEILIGLIKASGEDINDKSNFLRLLPMLRAAVQADKKLDPFTVIQFADLLVGNLGKELHRQYQMIPSDDFIDDMVSRHIAEIVNMNKKMGEA